MTLPTDPTHELALAQAEAALNAYVDDSRAAIDAEALRDLITDLGHWATSEGISFEKHVVHALATWWRETAEMRS